MILKEILKSKIHGAIITKTDLNYNGSIGIDRALLAASGISAGDKVQVLNFNNGERLETYVIEEKKGSGKVILYGPAAKRGKAGDRISILSYVLVDDEGSKKVKQKTVSVDRRNGIIKSD